MNKKTKIVFAVLVLLIPTYLAIFFYVRAQNAPVEFRSVSTAEITAPSGKVYRYDKQSDDGLSEIQFLTTINDRAKTVSELPASASEVPLFQVKFHSYNKDIPYKYYVGQDPSSAYVVTNEDKVFQLTGADASAFCDRIFAECLYPESDMPVLTVGESNVVPSSLSWHYQLFSGNTRDCDVTTTKEILNYTINSRLNMSFNVQPDIFTLIVKEGNKELFHDDYANIGNFALTESKDLTFHIEAKWYEVVGEKGKGEAVYDFTAHVNTPPSFYMTTVGKDFVPGDFFMITAKDVVNGEIKFTAEPSINYNPVFVADGDYYRALIPVNYTLKSGKYTFTLESDGVSQTFDINVKNKNFARVDYTVDNSIVSATRTEATLAKFESTMGPVATSLEIPNGVMFYGKFSEGISSDYQIRTGVGVYRTINGKTEYRHQGCDYLCPTGTTITAVNDGKVIYTGSTDLSGNIVVIEHGLGLKSWYCHLSEISVKVGDEVKKGTTVGLSGNTGFTDQSSAHIGLSVFDVPVSPYNMWENELMMIEP